MSFKLSYIVKKLFIIILTVDYVLNTLFKYLDNLYIIM
jgi:hypothetical protein